MRRIVLHRRAVKSLRGMPRDRQAKIVQALEEIAAVQNLGEHPIIPALRPFATLAPCGSNSSCLTDIHPWQLNGYPLFSTHERNHL
jgi:hypothetical protein